jgi:hypothetical protein
MVVNQCWATPTMSNSNSTLTPLHYTISHSNSNTILETEHSFLGDTYVVQYVSTFFYMGQCQRIVFLDFGS